MGTEGIGDCGIRAVIEKNGVGLSKSSRHGASAVEVCNGASAVEVCNL